MTNAKAFQVNQSTARLIHGDAPNALIEHIDIDTATLVYMDPPFMTGKTHKTSGGEIAFEDPNIGLDEFSDSVAGVAHFSREFCKSNGSIVVHIDPKTSHYVKVALDRRMGTESFASEIIWRYRRWPTKTKNFQRMHDVLLRYVVDPSAEPTWNQLYDALAPSTVKAFGNAKQLAVCGKDGKRKRSRITAKASPGAPMSDVWDIPIIAPMAKERNGYPTQKPEALLERLILATTNPGDTVLDPYCGSGTTLAVAVKHGRNAIGIDRSAEAIRVATERMQALNG